MKNNPKTTHSKEMKATAAQVLSAATPAQINTLRNIDPYEEFCFFDLIGKSEEPMSADLIDSYLHVSVNAVEGDITQLSPALTEYATQKGWI